MTQDVRLVGKLGLATLLASALFFAACNREKKSEDAPQPDADATGQIALDDGDWSRAFDSFSKAIEANAKNVDAYYGRAAASLARAREHYALAQAHATNQKLDEGKAEADKADAFFKKAVADADAVLNLDPKYAEAWFLKGVACQYQGMWNEGIEAFSECVALDGECAEAYHRRGEIYDHVGDYMNSSLDFKKASELGYADESNGNSASASTEAPDDFSDLNYNPEETTPAEEQ